MTTPKTKPARKDGIRLMRAGEAFADDEASYQQREGVRRLLRESKQAKPARKPEAVDEGSGDIWKDLGLKRPSNAALRRQRAKVEQLMRRPEIWAEAHKPMAPKAKARKPEARKRTYVATVVVEADGDINKGMIRTALRANLNYAGLGGSWALHDKRGYIVGWIQKVRVRSVDLD